MIEPMEQDNEELLKQDKPRRIRRCTWIYCPPWMTAWLWTVQRASSVVARALGLQLLVSFIRRITDRRFQEPPKIAISRSRSIALLRALVHVVPLGVALAELCLNWKGIYLGPNFDHSSYLQFAAKAHEMTMQASLAAILFTYLRHEISMGGGIPFGALLAGLQLNQLSYLWSIEFWGSAFAEKIRLRTRIRLAIAIAVFTSLAACVGPSSAILLIPRLEYWPAGHVHLYMNITAQELWPSGIDESLVPPGCSLSEGPGFTSSCPSAQWQTIQAYMAAQTLGLPGDLENFLPRVELWDYNWAKESLFPFAVQLAGATSRRQLQGTPASAWGEGDSEIHTIATTQQSSIADALVTVADLWGMEANVDQINRDANADPDNNPYWRDAVHTISEGYYQPYTTVSCALLALNTSYYWTIREEYSGRYDATYRKVAGIPLEDFMDTPGNVSDIRIRWIDQMPDLFNEDINLNETGNSSLGIAIFLPKPPSGVQTDQDAGPGDYYDEEPAIEYCYLCSLTAAWGSSSLNTSLVHSSLAQVLSSPKPSNGASSVGYPTNGPEALQYMCYNIWNQEPDWLGDPITIASTWAEYIDPVLPETNKSILQTLISPIIQSDTENSTGAWYNYTMLSELTLGDTRIRVEQLLSLMFANGLSRIGHSAKLVGDLKATTRSIDDGEEMEGLQYALPPLSDWIAGKDVFTIPGDEKEFLRLRVSSQREGYAFSSRGVPAKLATVALSIYCALAIAHLIYCGIVGVSSTSWDSIAELTALAVNSSPTDSLRNTCAGIFGLQVFKTPVRIAEVTSEFNDDGDGDSDEAGAEAGHLELVFGDFYAKGSDVKPVAMNGAYGTMAKNRLRSTYS
ncbi:MAG: hypothetical protein M1819_007012 [Sarea resinae]|nr:MAG: hypothetical protein M1819_007012 [Sarea resinae]